MEEIFIKDEFIKLGQALKLAYLAGSGVEAKVYDRRWHCYCQWREKELRREKKFVPGYNRSRRTTGEGKQFMILNSLN